ncbi:MAG: MFS transporter [Planctomycetales bacterium]|nr:MFS transporter [Planctomycetales bacterium]
MSQPTRYRYRAVAWLTTAAALAYLGRNAVGVAESTIRRDLSLSLEQSGWFMGAFFWTYAALQVPSGTMIQRVGTRRALACLVVLWSFATCGIGLATGFVILVSAQMMMGASQAGAFPAACYSIGHWMPVSRRSLACGVLAAGMQVGAIVASGLTGVLLAPLGWRTVFLCYGAPGLIWATCFFLRFRDDPTQVAGVNAAELHLIQGGRSLSATEIGRCDTSDSVSACEETLPDSSLPATTSRPRLRFLVLLCGQQICRAAGYMFFASWFPTFLQETRGVSIVTSGYQQALVLAGTLLGSLGGGVITDWVLRRTNSLRASRGGVGTLALGGCAALIFLANYVRDPNLAVVLLAVGAFSAALAGPCALAATIDVGGRRVAELFGLINMCGNFAAAACPVVVAWLVQWTGNWQLVLLMFAATYLIGAGCWLFIAPDQPRESSHNRLLSNT